MKKYLSLVLAMALVLTTLALPVAAANDISLLAVQEEKITVSLVPSKTAANPGDTITVDVVAKAPTKEITVNAGQVDVNFDENAFVYTDVQGDLINVVPVAGSAETMISWINEETTTTITTDGTKLFSLELKVADTAVSADPYEFTVVEGNTMFEYYSMTDPDTVSYDVTPENANVTVSANTYEVKVDDVALVNGTTYVNKNGVKLTITGTNLETVTLNNDENLVVDGVVAEQTLTAGEYTLSVKVVGSEAVVHTFAVSQTVTQATLAIDADATEYVRGGTINVTATIGGLGERTADVIAFELKYDAAMVTPVAMDGLKVENGTATYVFEENATNGVNPVGDGEVATIAFTVNEAAAYGNTTVALDTDSVKIALTSINGVIEAVDASCTVTDSEAKVVIIPAEGIAWAVADTSGKTGWSETEADDEYTVNVKDIVDGASVKYVVATTATTDTDEQLYKNTGAIDATNGISINSEAKYYYVVAKIGDDPAAYELVDTLVNGEDVFYDITPPEVTTNELNMTDWASTVDAAYTIPVTAETWAVSDTFATTATYNDKDITNGIVIAKGTSLNDDITIVVKDLAGNKTEATVKVMVDGDLPTVTITAYEQADGKINLNVDAKDTTSSLASVKAYYFDTAVEDGVDVTTGTEYNITDYVITADKSGVYYVVAIDNAGNKTVDSETVTILGAATVPDVTFKTVNATDAVAGSFKTDAELADLGMTSNGTFTYVSYVVDDDVDETNETVATLKNGENVVGAIEGAGTYKLTLRTVNGGDESTAKEVSYTFEIVDNQSNMKSVSGDARYNIRDYAKIRNIIGTETGDGLSKITSAHNFATYLAGDLDGNLQMTTNDYAAIITALKAGEVPGYYTFAIMNVSEAE